MAKVTLVFALLLVILGLAGYLGTGSQHPTALIPTWVGLALGVSGFFAISPNEKRRKLFMHVAVTVGLVGFIGATIEAIRGTVHAHAQGLSPDPSPWHPNSAWRCFCSSTSFFASVPSLPPVVQAWCSA